MDKEEQIINPNKRKITKLDADNKAIETFSAEILREDEGENSESTLITLEKLTKGNWRVDDSLSFVKSELDEAPEAEDDFTTRIMSTKGGDIWLIPPQGKSKIKLTQAALSDEQLKNIDSVPNKANNTDLNIHVANKLNPHGVTTTQIGAEPAFATLPISKGGTGATTATTALINLGAEPAFTTLPVSKGGTGVSSWEVDLLIGTDSNGAIGGWSKYEFDRPWRALWTGSQSATGTITIANFLTTISNPKEILILGANTSGTSIGMSAIIVPIYVKNAVGSSTQFINPSTTDKITGASCNIFSLPPLTGGSNAYNIVVRFNSTTQIQTTFMERAVLLGIYVR